MVSLLSILIHVYLTVSCELLRIHQKKVLPSVTHSASAYTNLTLESYTTGNIMISYRFLPGLTGTHCWEGGWLLLKMLLTVHSNENAQWLILGKWPKLTNVLGLIVTRKGVIICINKYVNGGRGKGEGWLLARNNVKESLAFNIGWGVQ